MKRCKLTAWLFSLWLLTFICTGCSGVFVKTNGPQRTVVGFSFITDRQIGEMDIKTPEGGSFKLSDAKSNQSKAIEAIKIAFDLMKWLIP